MNQSNGVGGPGRGGDGYSRIELDDVEVGGSGSRRTRGVSSRVSPRVARREVEGDSLDSPLVCLGYGALCVCACLVIALFVWVMVTTLGGETDFNVANSTDA